MVESGFVGNKLSWTILQTTMHKSKAEHDVKEQPMGV